MRIAISGATGLIGQALTKNLLEAQHSIVVLTRDPHRAASPQSHLQIVTWDGRNAGVWHRQIDEADVVINLAGESLASGRWTRMRKQVLISSRLDPTTAIVNAMKGASTKPRTLLNASAVGYYGPIEEGDIAEDHPPGADFTSRLCVEWEQAALEAQAFGVRVVLLRSGIVLDPRGGALRRMLLPFRLLVGGPLGSGNQWLPWIHKEDEVRAIRFLVEHASISGPVNLAAPESTRMSDFSAALGKAMGRPSALRVPAFALRALLGEMAEIVLTGQRVVPKKLLEAGFTFRFPLLKNSLADLLGKDRTLDR